MMRLQAVRLEGEDGDAFVPSSIGWVVVQLSSSGYALWSTLS
jgi:hypothetical protein